MFLQGQPLELVNQKAAPGMGLPLSLWTYDGKLRDELNGVLYQESLEGCVPSGTATPASKTCRFSKSLSVSYEFFDGQVSARKKITFDDSYVAKIETSVRQNDAAVQAYPAWPSGFGDQRAARTVPERSIDQWTAPLSFGSTAATS